MTRQMMKNKWSQLKIILNNLRVPKQIGEIEKLVFKNPSKRDRRTVYNYLNELVALGLIEYNEITRTYQKVGVRKRVFASKDLEQAVKHAKYLILSDEKKNTQRFDDYHFLSVVDAIAFYEESKREDSNLDKLVYQHIESGYYEIFRELIKYKKFVKENGLTVRKKLDRQRMYLREGEELTAEEEARQKLFQEKDVMNGKIMGLIHNQIISPVQEGQPLLGECDQCPHLKFSVKD